MIDGDSSTGTTRDMTASTIVSQMVIPSFANVMRDKKLNADQKTCSPKNLNLYACQVAVK